MSVKDFSNIFSKLKKQLKLVLLYMNWIPYTFPQAVQIHRLTEGEEL